MYCRQLVRNKALADFYEGLSPEDKLLFSQLSSKGDIYMQKLDEIEQKIDKNRHPFWLDVSSNVVGNYIADASIYVASKILKSFIRP